MGFYANCGWHDLCKMYCNFLFYAYIIACCVAIQRHINSFQIPPPLLLPVLVLQGDAHISYRYVWVAEEVIVFYAGRIPWKQDKLKKHVHVAANKNCSQHSDSQLTE